MTSPDWLVERGIGERRAVRVAGGEIVEARVLLDGIVPAGSVLQARLTRAGRPGIATAESEEYVLRDGAGPATEGQAIAIEVVRERIPGAEPWKRPLARVSDETPRAPEFDGTEVAFPDPHDPLEEAGWSELVEEARIGLISLDGHDPRARDGGLWGDIESHDQAAPEVALPHLQ